MSSSPFQKTTEKALEENHTSSASHEFQPHTSESHVNDQDAKINSLPEPTPLEPNITTAVQEKSEPHINQNGHPEYPHGITLATITVAVAVSVFLVALVCSSLILGRLHHV
jgi:hypothetical protein